MAEPVIRDSSKYETRRHIVGSIVLSIAFLFVSFTTFYGVRIFFPIITNYGRSALNTLPCALTYLIPLFIFYMALFFVYAKTNETRLKSLKLLGITLILLAVFNLILITFVIVLLLDGNLFFQTMTPMYPLDVIFGNVIYFIVGICCLFYEILDKKYSMTVSIRQRPFLKKDFILAGFILPFATYFLGEFLFGIMYLQEGYIDKNWYYMLPVYLSFLLLAALCVVYFVYHYIKEKNRTKFHIISLIIFYSLEIILGIWIVVGYINEPYLTSLSLQWEFEIGLALKIPIGLFINFIFSIPILIVSTLKLFKNLRKKKNEQE